MRFSFSWVSMEEQIMLETAIFQVLKEILEKERESIKSNQLSVSERIKGIHFVPGNSAKINIYSLNEDPSSFMDTWDPFSKPNGSLEKKGKKIWEIDSIEGVSFEKIVRIISYRINQFLITSWINIKYPIRIGKIINEGFYPTFFTIDRSI